jgi:DNA-binding beta-propeller fold protein YncE
MSSRAATAARGFTAGPDYTFVQTRSVTVVRTAVAQRPAAGATVAPDGVTYFIDAKRGRTEGGWLVSKAKKVFHETPEVHDIEFSPDGAHVAVLDDMEKTVAVLTVPAGEVVRTFTGAYLVRFRSPTILQYRTLCQIFEADVTSTAEPRPVGPKVCGGADVSDDASLWIVAQPHNHGIVFNFRQYTTVTRIDGATGRSAVLPISDAYNPSVSAAGKRICYGQAGLVTCIDAATGATDAFRGDPGRLVWGDGDNKVIVEEGRALYIANFRDHSMRKLIDTTDIRYWRFFPSGNRVYVYDKGSRVLDLEKGVWIEVYSKRTEVGGFTPVPGRDDRFMTGNEIGPTRVHYWIDLVQPAVKKR